ncbi:MAG: uroporphyrinogen-III synthase [Candidatus Schekmanbacteria bacterium]|nr:uroporphyrinogen-III synthase [Candidatus Schekmanbacteria bacterium]
MSERAPGSPPAAPPKVLITRARGDAGGMANLVAARGAIPVLLPTIAIRPPLDWAPADAAIDRLECYAWIVFTSRNAVHSFAERCRLRRPESEWPPLCAVGDATAAALAAIGRRPCLIPDLHNADGVVRAFSAVPHSGRILFPAGDLARDTVADGLARQGAAVDVVVVYRTAVGEGDLDPTLRDAMLAGEIAAYTFTSPSAAEGFARLVGPTLLASVRARGVIASIGPTTTAALTELGLKVDVEPRQPGIPQLIDALDALLSPAKAGHHGLSD